MRRNGRRRSFVICRCQCGSRKIVEPYDLVSGRIQSCGCLRREQMRVLGLSKKSHGAVGTPEYMTWSRLLKDCRCKTSSHFHDYGGRGIKVCRSWSGPNGFAHFLADMGKRPGASYSIDRKDNDGPYCKQNCRWATAKEQARNRRNTIRLTVGGVTKTLAEWAESIGIRYGTLHSRLRSKWDPERVVTAPVNLAKIRVA